MRLLSLPFIGMQKTAMAMIVRVCCVLSLYSWQTRERRQRTKMAMREVKRITFAHAQHEIAALRHTHTRISRKRNRSMKFIIYTRNKCALRYLQPHLSSSKPSLYSLNCNGRRNRFHLVGGSIEARPTEKNIISLFWVVWNTKRSAVKRQTLYGRSGKVFESETR